MDEEALLDRNGKPITNGCIVKCTDPQTREKEVYEVFGVSNDGFIRLWNGNGECEALPEEIEVVEIVNQCWVSNLFK